MTMSRGEADTKSPNGGDQNAGGRLSRKEAVPYIKRWLSENVVESEEGSLLKRELFEAYLRFCMFSNLNPTNDATFGRMVNAVFPNVQQRRLRRDSHVKKWHYCGIAYRSGPGRPSPSSSPPASGSQPLTTSTSHHPPPTFPPQSQPVPPFAQRSAYPSPSNFYHSNPGAPSSSYQYHGCPPPTYHPSMTQSYHQLYSGEPTTVPFQHASRPPPQPFASPAHPYTPLSAYSQPHLPLHSPAAYGSHFHSPHHLAPPIDELAHSPLHPTIPPAWDPYGPSHAVTYLPTEGEATQTPHESSGRLGLTGGSAAEGSAKQQSGWLRNLDHTLPFLAQLQFYADFYRHEIWGFEPLNPISMKSDTLRYLFTTDEGARERSPLSLCTHYVLCAGALLSGNIAQAKEHFIIARDHLGYLFDISNYDVACILCYIATIARYFAQSEREGKELSHYYLTLGLEICESIRAVNDDLFVTLTKYGVIFLHRFGEEQSLLIKSKAAPRWRKPWKQGKHYIEQYRYGKFVGASQEYVVDSLRQLVLILMRPPHEPPSPEEWWALRETYEWRCGAIAELDQLYARDGRAPQQLTTFMRLYVYFCRAVCNLRLNLVDDARQAASDFLLILSRGNRGVVTAVLSDMWWMDPCRDAFVELVVFLQRQHKQELVQLALALLELGKIDLVWAAKMHDQVTAALAIVNEEDNRAQGTIDIKKEQGSDRDDGEEEEEEEEEEEYDLKHKHRAESERPDRNNYNHTNHPLAGLYKKEVFDDDQDIIRSSENNLSAHKE